MTVTCMYGFVGVYLLAPLFALAVANSVEAMDAGSPEVIRPAPADSSSPVALPDGTVKCYFMNMSSQRLLSIRSTDHGRTWSEPVVEFATGRTHHGVFALVDDDGDTHVFYLDKRYVGVEPGEGKVNKTYFIDVLHRKKESGGQWSQPHTTFQGYCGALLGAVQMDSGRIVLPLGMWNKPGEPVPGGGQNSVGVVYSDDDGETWQRSPAQLTAPTYQGYNGNNYGAIEPAVVQLADGRLWMLFRTQTGFLYESHSEDGVHWTEARPSRFHSSNSPPGMLRLRDGRVAVFWNNTQQPPKHVGGTRDGMVYGGREALHAAIANGDGTQWRGFREIYLDPTRHDSPPRKGDRGTAYPCATEAADGTLIVATGQGEHARRILRIDPDWLTQTKRRDDFSDGLRHWTAFRQVGPVVGAVWRDRELGARVIQHEGADNGRALHLQRAEHRPGDGAIWNFPLGTAGQVELRLRVEPGFGGGEIALLDRFVDPAADTAGDPPRRAAFLLELDTIEGIEPGQRHTLTLQWDLKAAACRVMLDGRSAGPLEIHEPTNLEAAQPPRSSAIPNGLCYLMLRSTAAQPDTKGWLVDSVSAEAIDPYALSAPMK